MENRNYADIIGNPSAPYLNQLANSYGVASNYHDVSPYGSLPNYLGTIAGQTYDGTWSRCNSPPSSCAGWPSGGVTDPTMVSTIESAGLTWKAYMESMPSDCYAQNSGSYMTIHNPFVYFSHVINTPSECAKVVPAGTGDSALLSDLSSTSGASNFIWLTPNNCDDMWGCSTSAGDTYLSNLVPKIMSSSVFQTQKAALFITWDEGSNSGHVPGIWAGPVVKHGYSSGVDYGHYSILRTIETAWGLSSLTSNDASATAMTEFFTASNSLQTSFTFTPTTPIVGQNVTFTGSASGGTPPYTLVWDFGDGTTGFGSTIRHAYTTQGSDTVTLTAKDSTGLTGGSSQVVTVSGPPDYTVSLNPTSLVVSLGGSGTAAVTLKSLNGFAGSISLGASTSPSGLVTSFSQSSLGLSSGGTATSTLTIQAPSTIQPGNYTVTVTATNGSLTHSAILLVSARVAPDFTISTSPTSLTTIQGGSASSTITLTSLNGFSGPVSLSATVSAGGFGVQIYPNNPNVSPGSSSISNLTITSPNNVIPESYLVTLKAQSGSITHTITLPLTVTSFALDVNPGSITFPPGSTGTVRIVLSSINGFSGSVTLSARTNNNKLTATLASQIINLPAGGTVSAPLTLASSAQGGYTVTVTASTGKLSKNLQFAVSVSTKPDFFLSSDPIFLVVSDGSSATSTITVTSVNGLSGTVNLKLAVNPAGPVVSLTQLSVRLVSGGSASSILMISIPSSTQPGIYSITVTGTDGPTHPVILTIFVTRPVPDFSLNIIPNSQTVAAGQSASYNISLTSLNGFSGNVTLTTSSQPGLSPSLNPTVLVLNSGGSASSILTITTTSATSPATYRVSITATSGSTTHSATITLVVTPAPDFTLNASPQTQTVFANNFATSTISRNNVNGFAGTVTLTSTVSPTTGLNCSLNPLAISRSQTSTLSCDGIAGSYTVTVTGSSRSLNRSVNVTFIVQDFTVSASPTTINLTAGGSGTSTIIVASLQGFNHVVDLTVTTSSTISASLNPTSVTGSGNSTLSVSGTIPGTYTVNVTGTSNTLFHQVTVQVNVNGIQDFTMSASPASVTDDANSPGVSKITVTAVNGFTGTVTLSQNGGPGCFLSSPSVTLTMTSTSSSVTLSCTYASAGNNQVTVTGNSGTITHSTTVTFTVQDFTIGANPTSLSVTASQAGTSNITVTALQGFTGTVNLATNSTSCTITPNAVNGSGSARLSCAFTSTGAVQVAVTGTSGSFPIPSQ